MELDLIKRKLQAELDVSTSMGDVRLYKFLKDEILHGDESAADEFMLSDHGGYTPGELNAIKFRFMYLQGKNRQKASIPISAF